MSQLTMSQTHGVRGQVFVVPNSATINPETTYADFIANANEGDLGIFLEDGSVAVPSTGDKYFIAQKRNGSIVKSELLTKGTDDKVIDFQPRAKQEVTVQVTATPSQPGDTFELKLIETTDSVGVDIAFSYEFVSVTGSETPTQIATAIALAYTNREQKVTASGIGEKSIFDVTSSGDTLTITTLDYGVQFEAFFSLNLETQGATITTTVDYARGFGFGDEVFEYERKGDIQDGSYMTNVDIRDKNRFAQGYFTNRTKSYDAVSLVSTNGPERVNGRTMEGAGRFYNLTVEIFTETDAVETAGSTNYTDVVSALSL